MDDRSDTGAAPPSLIDAHRNLIDAAATVRAALASKRSDKLSRLFDFLLSRTLAGSPPSELEIADAVFSTGRALDVSQDATVRVYVHRLRKTLDQIYEGQPPPRLHIPRGEYRVVLDGVETPPAPAPAIEPPPVAIAAPRRLPYPAIWIALALLLFVNLAGWWLTRPAGDASAAARLADTRLWRNIARDTRPITIVLGDYYMFADATEAGTAPRYVRDPAINSSEDLDVYLMRFPARIGQLTDRNLNYVPTSSIVALGDLYRATQALRGDRSPAPRIVPVSQLTPDILKNSDVVYVGLVSGLGSLLRNPLFQASGFKVGTSYDELIDAASGRHFVSDGVVIADEHVPRRDYGYLASLPGPSGNHLVVIASLRDPALLQMAELARDPDKLQDLGRTTLGATGFEALYQVRTMGSLNLNGRLLVARSLRSRAIWDTTQPSQHFPDDGYEGDAAHARP